MPPREVALHLFHRTLVHQRHHAAALHAHEMIVVTTGIEQLEMARRTTKMHALHESKRLELLHRAKNRGKVRHAAMMRGMFADLVQAQRRPRRQ